METGPKTIFSFSEGQTTNLRTELNADVEEGPLVLGSNLKEPLAKDEVEENMEEEA